MGRQEKHIQKVKAKGDKSVVVSAGFKFRSFRELREGLGYSPTNRPSVEKMVKKKNGQEMLDEMMPD